MPKMSQALVDAMGGQCAIARSLGVLNDPWSFLLLREAHRGKRTFAQFKDSLGIASDVLSLRLNALVDRGVLERVAYQEPGQRARDAYELTRAGAELKVVLVAMMQWGEEFLPAADEQGVLPVTADKRERVRAKLVNESGEIETLDNVKFIRVPAE